MLFLSQLPRLDDIIALILHIAVINMLCVKYWLHHLVRYIAFRLTGISENYEKMTEMKWRFDTLKFKLIKNVIKRRTKEAH